MKEILETANLTTTSLGPANAAGTEHPVFSGDNYAVGDSRIPKIIGKNKKKTNLYKRHFIELLANNIQKPKEIKPKTTS